VAGVVATVMAFVCFLKFRQIRILARNNYQPLSRRDFEEMVTGVFDDDDDVDSDEDGLEMGEFNGKQGGAQQKLDFDNEDDEEGDSRV